MMISQKQLFEIAKKLLIFSGKKSKVSLKEKNIIIPQLEGILLQIHDDSSSLSKKIQIFIQDILSDILHDRVINIDSILEDEYVENFFQSEAFVYQYNSLLKTGEYDQFISCLKDKNTKNTYTYVIQLLSKVQKVINNINCQKFQSLF